jgi:hypothetical protein
MLEEVLKPKSKDEIENLEKRGFRKDCGKWKFKIDIIELVKKFEEDQNVNEFKNSIIEVLDSKISDIALFVDGNNLNEFKEIVQDFKNINEDVTADSFDESLSKLYDWTDDNNVWVESF